MIQTWVHIVAVGETDNSAFEGLLWQEFSGGVNQIEIMEFGNMHHGDGELRSREMPRASGSRMRCDCLEAWNKRCALAPTTSPRAGWQKEQSHKKYHTLRQLLSRSLSNP